MPIVEEISAIEIAGTALLIIGVIVASYTLLFRTIEMKRIIAFAVILLFCGTFLILYERIVEVEFGTIGKITVQAKADADEIRNIRTKMEQQHQVVDSLMQSMLETADRVSTLAKDVETDITTLQKSQAADRKQNLLKHLEIVNGRIAELQKAEMDILPTNDFEELHKIMAKMGEQSTKKKQLLKELELLGGGKE
ncbi:MAG: hypothetical protein ABW148_13255 [Sedimenticola sp.]